MIQHFGGGSGLLFNEIEKDLAENAKVLLCVGLVSGIQSFINNESFQINNRFRMAQCSLTRSLNY